MRDVFNSGMGGDRAWPALLLLLLAVLAPTACVLWFMNEAMHSERQAVQQRLAEAYHSHLQLLRERVEEYLAKRTIDLEHCAEGIPASAAFARCVGLALGDSIIVLGKNGQPLYPNLTIPGSSDPVQDRQDWIGARRLEEQDPAGAAAAYRSIAASELDVRIRALAIQAEERNLLTAGRKDSAVALAADQLGTRQYERATDVQGRLIAADAQLMVLQVVRNPDDARFRRAAHRLRELVLDYNNPGLSSAQRLFLIGEMQPLHLPAGPDSFPCLEAERLAARFLEAEPVPSAGAILTATALPDVWKLGSTRAVALYRTSSIRALFRRILSDQTPPNGLQAEMLPPGAALPKSEAMSTAGGSRLPGWTLTLNTERVSDQLAERRMTIYLWTGILTIATVVVLVVLTARMIRRQARLARLKADLVATVSHELKTPVTSMRLLVDTLLDEDQLDLHKTREYLELIARENTRLSRLIDNFLTFSRMERNKQAFEFRLTEPAAVLQSASDAVRERFAAADCRLEVEFDPRLPAVYADEDALVTMLLNLLDNALKYSTDNRRVTVRAFSRGARVCFEVEDRGVGIPPREARKIFQKFYQVDLRLSRRVGGVGLGLSIVQFIVKAHAGRIRVESKPGQGSKFTVWLPAAAIRQSVAV